VVVGRADRGARPHQLLTGWLTEFSTRDIVMAKMTDPRDRVVVVEGIAGFREKTVVLGTCKVQTLLATPLQAGRNGEGK
jgi:hypothetical protein